MQSGLTPLDQALAQLLGDLGPITAAESVSLSGAVGRILSQDLSAPIDVPAWDNSAMDGYAVATGSLSTIPVVLPVSQRIPAGCAGGPLQAGTAARIFTGAPLPPGADAVIMQENTEPHGDGVNILQSVASGENVRGRGDDIRKGSVLFKRGHRLRVQDMHVLSACGLASLPVHGALSIAVLNTGDELVRPGTDLQAGQIYNSNFYLIAALLERLGMQWVDGGTVGDRLDATVDKLRQAAESADCVITSGGVSVGEEDHVKAAVQQLGRIDLWKLAVKPGKPFAWGQVAGKPFFGLPGNPVSAFVTFVLLVRPALLALAGARAGPPLALPLPAAFEASSGERREYLRVRVASTPSGHRQMQICTNQSSGAGSSLGEADGLAVVPPFTTVKHGDMLDFISLAELVD